MKKDESVRVAVIGLKGMGGGHARVIRNRLGELAEIVALCDSDEAFLDKMAKEWSLPHYVDYREMIDKEMPDMLVIAVPNYLHEPMINYALQRDIHVFAEKPVHTSVEGCLKVRETAMKSKGRLFFDLELRNDPCLKEIKRCIEKREFGEAVSFWIESLRGPYQKSWMLKKEFSGGGIPDKCVHYFDIFMWMFESKPVRVAAFGGQTYRELEAIGKFENGVMVESDQTDNNFVIIQFANGGRAMVNQSMLGWMTGRSHFKMGCSLERALIETEGVHSGLVEIYPYGKYPYENLPDKQIRSRIMPPGQKARSGHHGLTAMQMENALNAIRNDSGHEENMKQLDDAVFATLVGLLAEESIVQNGKTLAVPDIKQQSL